ncbi:DUF349 domain-containing protein [Georgenia wutianyii]|uniref:DUF349 domain-containing protein n=1 Tax=Georgenia wutianyii TaxID=2585135 RepID=UPI001E4AAF1E|nr:DUF349 domain-containing protein [Georgenia wutianyii]
MPAPAATQDEAVERPEGATDATDAAEQTAEPVAEATPGEQADAEPEAAPEAPAEEPAVAEPPAEPDVTEPAVAEPPVAEPTVAEPDVAEPAVAEPPVAEPAVAEPPVAEPPVAEPAVAEPAVAEPDVAEEPAAATEEPAEEAPATEPAATAATEEPAEEPAPTPAEEQPAAEAGAEEPGGSIEVDAAPRPAVVPKPSSLPKPSALPKRTPGTPAPAVTVVAPVIDDSKEAAAAAAWGRVDPDGTVWVREAAGERTVGQYTGADTDEALAFYVRRFLDLQAQVALFETRLPQLQIKEIDQTIATLTEALAEPAAVGDLDGLRSRLEAVRERAKERRREINAEREAAKAQALAERTTIVERAEAIAATDPAKVHWRSSGEELRTLLEEWKQAQRNGPRLDRPSEDSLWKRFSRARTTFDRNRGHYFSQLDAAQSEAKKAKEQLIAEAEALSTSTDWGRTSAAYRDLMDRWKAAGRASRKEDDALWARFRAARQRFFEARESENAQIDAEYSANLEAKLRLLEEAEALLPVTDPEAAKAALRPIQDKWDEAGKVPRADVQRVEARMRAVEQAVRDADQERWKTSDPEKQARAQGAAAQLYEAIDALEAQLAAARAAGDTAAEKAALESLETRKTWLDQILRTAGS